MAEKLKPGVYPRIPFDDYARWDAVNHSKLKHFRRTPAHARYAMLNQDESTKYQDLGHMIHQALLEPEVFAQAGTLVAPKIDRRTTAGKREWAEFEEAAAGKMVVSESDMDALLGISKSVSMHATARQSLYGVGVNELSIVWEDPETGILCKGRIDRLCEIEGYPFVIDLKTTSKPASTHAWQQSVESYGYHEQAAHYLRGLSVLRPLEGEALRRYAWLVVETVPPYCVRVFEAEEACLSVGNDEISKYLKAYSECDRTGVWPAWPEGMDLAGLPAWVYKRFNIE